MSILADCVARQIDALSRQARPSMVARVTRYDGLILQCSGIPVSPGAICAVETEDGGTVRGEVVGFSDGRTLLFLDAPGARIAAGARVQVGRFF